MPEITGGADVANRRRTSGARWLVGLAVAMGGACATIGVVHFAFGAASVPGEGSASATVDSRERFYAAIFLGYGLAWLWAARQRPVRAVTVQWLAAIFFAGGVGRLLSLAVAGSPQWFQLVLAGVELVLPPVLWGLAGADERS